MKNKHLWIPLFIFLGAGVVSLVASIIDFKAVNKVQSYSSQTIQFNYEGASDGKDPRGNPFNATDFLSDEIIEKSLQETGLDYDVDKVKAYLTISNVVPKSVIKEINSYNSLTDISDSATVNAKDYHPVRYRFCLYSDIGLSEGKTKEFLGNIVNTYCQEFLNVYSKSFDKETYGSVYNVEDYDYIYQTQVFTNKISVLMDYASSVYKERSQFTTENGSFDDLCNRCQSLINSDVFRIRNLITLNALSKDLPRLENYYTFKIQRLTYDKVQYTSDLNNVTDQINSFTKDTTFYIGNGETMVKVESNSSATYDELLASQISLSSQISRINAEITEYNAILDDIHAATGTEEEYALVRAYLEDLGEDYQEVEDLFVTLLEAYNNRYISTRLFSRSQVNYTSGSLFSSAFIMRCIKVGAPIMLTVMLGIAIYFLIRELRKQNSIIQNKTNRRSSVCLQEKKTSNHSKRKYT